MASTLSAGISERMVRESPLNRVTLSKLSFFIVLQRGCAPAILRIPCIGLTMRHKTDGFSADGRNPSVGPWYGGSTPRRWGRCAPPPLPAPPQ